MSKDRLSHPLCQKLKREADEMALVVIEKTGPYWMRGSGRLYFYNSKYYFAVTDETILDDQHIFAEEWVYISFTDEDIETIEYKTKNCPKIYLK